MILVYTLKNNFTNMAILSVNSSIVIKREIRLRDFYIFCDDDFNVHSINVLNAKKYKIELNKTFYVLDSKKWSSIKKQLLEKKNNFLFSDFIKFQYGKILKREQHPKSKKLFLVTILKNKNDYETVTLVTNTLDSTEDKVIVFANKGSITALGLPILENEIMGIKSVGMLVSYESLGLKGNTLIFGDENAIGKEFIF